MSSNTAEQGPLLVALLSRTAVAPARATEWSAGYDLSSAHDYLIEAHGKCLVHTDIAVAIPPGHYGRVAPRSSLAWKHHIDTGAGVIDADYRGPLGVLLFNHSDTAYYVKAGDRVAQLILERISTPPVQVVTSLPPTTRGAGGFGSTGV
eukprot:m51a1_g2798 putative dutp-pyrophosphatase-like 1 (149) ;mRNA; r:75344-76068